MYLLDSEYKGTRGLFIIFFHLHKIRLSKQESIDLTVFK